jgi:RNA polymerase-binding protein DksA
MTSGRRTNPDKSENAQARPTRRIQIERSAHLQKLTGVLRRVQAERVKWLRNRNQFDEPVPGDSADSALSETDLELGTSLVEIAASRVAALENALSKAEHGIYGLCEECGEDIPLARLQALPTAALCVDCQQALESKPSWQHEEMSSLPEVLRDAHSLGRGDAASNGDRKVRDAYFGGKNGSKGPRGPRRPRVKSNR